MKLERLQKYKLELSQTPTRLWGEVLFRMVSEAENRGKNPEDTPRRDHEDLKLKFTIALGALEVYAQETSFSPDEPASEIAHLAQVTLDKIKKVNWLTDNRPEELK